MSGDLGRLCPLQERNHGDALLDDVAPNCTPIELLLIDDDQADIYLAKRAIKQCKTRVDVQVARNGEEGLALLRQQAGHEDARRPDIIFLDINMPRMNGHEFLAAMKADQDLKSIPTIVMSTSKDEDDIRKSYELQASAYIAKPVELGEFADVIRLVDDHWFRTVRLPPRIEA
jgi:CheY-like chemotaxis protein